MSIESAGRSKSLKRSIEFIILFICLPLVFRYFPDILKRIGHGNISIPLIPVLILLTFPIYIFMRYSGQLSLRELIILNVRRSDWLRMLIRFVFFSILLSVFMYVKYPEHFLEFPRQNTRWWTVVMICYPIASVYPQGIIYRAFYTYRYSSLFHAHLRLIAGAAIFSFAHLAFANPIALVFTFTGGLFFLSSFNRTGSLLFSGIEHALYGNFMFTIGLGHFFFYQGTLRMMHIT